MTADPSDRRIRKHLPPPRLRLLLDRPPDRDLRGAVHQRRRRLAGLRPDPRPVRPRPGRAGAVPAVAAAGAGHRRRGRPLQPPPASWRICIAAEILCALALLVLTLGGDHRVWPIFLVLAGFGIARAFLGPAVQSLLPNLVPAGGAVDRDRLELLVLADRHHQRPGDRRPAVRPGAGGALCPRRGADGGLDRAGDADPQAGAEDGAGAGELGEPGRRLPLHLGREGGAGRDLARPLRRAAGRRHRAAAGLCPRHPRGRALGPRPAAGRPRHRRAGGGDLAGPPADRATRPG